MKRPGFFKKTEKRTGHHRLCRIDQEPRMSEILVLPRALHDRIRLIPKRLDLNPGLW